MTLTPEQQAEAKDMLRSYLQGCVPHANEEIFPGQTFWMKDGECRFDYDRKHPNSFWVRCSIWGDFGEKFNLHYNQISDLLKPLAEDAFKLGQITPTMISAYNERWVEDAFKLGQLEPTTWTAIQEQKQSTEYAKDLADLAMSGSPTIQPKEKSDIDYELINTGKLRSEADVDSEKFVSDAIALNMVPPNLMLLVVDKKAGSGNLSWCDIKQKIL